MEGAGERKKFLEAAQAGNQAQLKAFRAQYLQQPGQPPPTPPAAEPPKDITPTQNDNAPPPTEEPGADEKAKDQTIVKTLSDKMNALWEKHADALKLPPRKTAIKTILMLDRNLRLEKLDEDQTIAFSEEIELLEIFVSLGGTLEKAAEITNEKGFENGWFTGVFIDSRKKAVSLLADQNAE
jgi:hypothetical protein